MKFGAYGDSGKPQILERGPGDDYFDWVKFDRPTFDAPANVWQTIKMTINVPKSAAFGYYYAVVFTSINAEVDHTEHTEMYGRLVQRAATYEGYLGIEGARNSDGTGVAAAGWLTSRS